ncbi:MAG: hypothetical protein ABIB47_00945 [Candidatus Woesearchaeota archaeon]
MEANNKILVVAVLIVLLGVVTFNFNSISGAQTRESGMSAFIQNPQVTCSSAGYGQGRFELKFTLSGQGNVNSDLTLTDADDNNKRGGSYSFSSGSYAQAGSYSINPSCDQNILREGHRYFLQFRDRKGLLFDSDNSFRVTYT